MWLIIALSETIFLNFVKIYCDIMFKAMAIHSTPIECKNAC